jgi:hypothetical protein
LKFVNEYGKLLNSGSDFSCFAEFQGGQHRMNRDLSIKLTKILNKVTAGLILLLLITFALPYFHYTGGEKETISIWGYLGFPANFVQMKELLGVKFLSIKQLNVAIGLIIVGIISILVLLTKKGIATQLFPLIWCVWGVAGYFANGFLKLGNTFARPLQIAIVIIAALIVLFNIFLYIYELKTRPAEEYMDLDSWS